MRVDLANPVHRPSPSGASSVPIDRNGGSISLFDAFSSSCRLSATDQIRVHGRVFMEIKAGTKELYQSIASRAPRSAHPDEHHPPSATRPLQIRCAAIGPDGETPRERFRE